MCVCVCETERERERERERESGRESEREREVKARVRKRGTQTLARFLRTYTRSGYRSRLGLDFSPDDDDDEVSWRCVKLCELDAVPGRG